MKPTLIFVQLERFRHGPRQRQTFMPDQQTHIRTFSQRPAEAARQQFLDVIPDGVLCASGRGVALQFNGTAGLFRLAYFERAHGRDPICSSAALAAPLIPSTAPRRRCLCRQRTRTLSIDVTSGVIPYLAPLERPVREFPPGLALGRPFAERDLDILAPYPGA